MKKRVCAYARVSSNSSSQEHSFDFQSMYWNQTLANNPDYEYVGLYADKGISGKFAERRPQFMQMVSAIENGQIDIVFTKSVQRFARNTEELLKFVREFRELGVAVIFEKENINTLENDNDLYLTIAVAIAEEDLNRYSQNMTWMIQDKFKKGQTIVNGRLFGYEMGIGKGDSFRIIPSEAKIVREIYDKYLEGYSIDKLVKYLNINGIKSPLGSEWHVSSVERIISNEKYVGDCLFQKKYRYKGLTKENKGEKDQYYVSNHHKPIIPREVWDKVQQERLRRSNPKLVGRKIKAFPFTGLIYCGNCGKHYRHKVNKSYYTEDFDFWMCPSKKDECMGVRVKDEELKAKFVEAYNEFISMKYKGEEESIAQQELDKLTEQQIELNRLKTNGWISLSNYRTECDALLKKVNDAQLKVQSFKLRKLSNNDFKPISVFEESKVEKFLMKIVIVGIRIDFYFYNGVVVSRFIEHTRIYDRDKKILGITEVKENV